MKPDAHPEVGRNERLLLKHPREAWLGRENVRKEWRALAYAEEPDFGRACAEYDALAGILSRYALEVRFLPEDGRTGLDSI